VAEEQQVKPNVRRITGAYASNARGVHYPEFDMSMADYQGLNNGTRLPEQLPFILQNTDAGDTRYWDSTGVRRWGQYGAAGSLIRRKRADGAYEYLMIKRAAWGVGDPNKWSVPGGAHDTFEDSQNPHTTARRELLEELGVDIGSLEPSHTVNKDLAPDWRYNTVVFDVAEGKLNNLVGRKTREIADTRWMTADQIRGLQSEGKLHSGFDSETVDSLLNLPDSPAVETPNQENFEQKIPRLVEQAKGSSLAEIERLISLAPITTDTDVEDRIGSRVNSPLKHDSNALARLAKEEALKSGMTDSEANDFASATVTRATYLVRRLHSLAKYREKVEKAQNELERSKRDLERAVDGRDRVTAEAAVSNRQRALDALLDGESTGKDFANYVLSNGKIAVTLQGEALRRIIEGDGQYRTQFENPTVRNAGAVQSQRTRAENEYALYGIPVTNEDHAIRPAFGHIVADGLEDQEWFKNLDSREQERYRSFVNISSIENLGIMGAGFGDVSLVLKDSVRDRTSYSFGGSLRAGILPRSLKNGTDYDSQVAAGLYGSEGFGGLEGGGLISNNGRPDLRFIEAQIHGRFTLEDVDTIYAPAEKVEQIRGWLRSKGIGIEVKSR